MLALSFPALQFFGRTSALNNSAEEIINTLRLAEARTVASEGASPWGVAFSTSTTPHRYTLFKGVSFTTRDVSADRIYRLPSSVEIFQVNLTGNATSTAFDRIVGTTATYGTIVLRLVQNPTRLETVSILSSGRVVLGTEGAGSLPTPSPRDSRHVHVTYSRAISTATENIVLTFEGGAVQTVPIAVNMVAGQIDWQGTVNVAGQNQTIHIRTLYLNNPDTQFSVYRDRRLNTKAVALKLSGDTSGTLLEYSADGLTTIKTSVHAGTPEWQ